MNTKKTGQSYSSAKGRGIKGAGRNKVRSIQREYKNHCRTMRTAGNVNGSDGGWMSNAAALSLLGEKRVKMITGR